jgi:hypothetical protein
MRKNIFVVPVCLAYLGCVTFLESTGFGRRDVVAASPDETTKQTLIDLETQSWKAWKDRDGKFFQDFLSDDHVEVGLGGPADKAAVVRIVSSPMCKVEDYAIDHFAVSLIDSNTALVIYHATQKTSCNGTPVPSPVWATSVYVKRNDHWLNVLYQHSPAAK